MVTSYSEGLATVHEHARAESLDYLGVHRFAAGAAKTGVYGL
jgi:hypothetical protein